MNEPVTTDQVVILDRDGTLVVDRGVWRRSIARK